MGVTLPGPDDRPRRRTCALATSSRLNLFGAPADAWDLARATGQIDALDPAVCGTGRGTGHDQTRIPQPGRTGISATERELPPPPGADDWDRLAAFMDATREHRCVSSDQE